MSGQNLSSLLQRRKFSMGTLEIKVPTACVVEDTQELELQTKYKVSDEILGQGTTAVVKRGSCKENGHAVAIKEIKTYGDEELGKIMRKEYELLRSLRHPNIVGVYDFYLTPWSPKAYLCLQLVQGKTLETSIVAQGKIPEKTMRPLFEQLASALVYLHCKRIIHRDLKPANILVHDSMDKCLICDFNHAYNLADGCTLTTKVGTRLFAPPEVTIGFGLLGKQADIWSVGMCLYYALAGGRTLATGKKFDSNASFAKYLANATYAERQKWITTVGLSKEAAVAQVLWACLSPDPLQRPDAMLLLAHPWLLADKEEETPRFSHCRSRSTGDFEETPPSLARSRSHSIPIAIPNIFETKNGACHKRKVDGNRMGAHCQRVCANGSEISETDSPLELATVKLAGA